VRANKYHFFFSTKDIAGVTLFVLSSLFRSLSYTARRLFLPSYASPRWSSKARIRTVSQRLNEKEKSKAMLVAPSGGDGIGGGAAAGGGGNAAAPAATTTSTPHQHHPNPGSGLRRQSKTEIADAFVRSLRERGGLDVDAPGVAASIRSHFQLLPSR